MRVWKPAESCPSCGYLNDENFNFCQRCGFRAEVLPLSATPARINLEEIRERLSYLTNKKREKPYEKQKSALHAELSSFLISLPHSKTLASASPDDIVSFLVWKDKSGRTKVHKFDCTRGDSSECDCPKHLAAGSVDSLIGKLRSIFAQTGRGGEWNYDFGIGNPASHSTVSDYLKAIKEEQAQARTKPKKAVPLFMDKLEKLASHILFQLQHKSLTPIAIYIHARDLCFFTLEFFSGDRAADLCITLSKEVLFFPDKSGLLFNHTYGKTLRGDAHNTFAVRACPNHLLCPVTNFQRYISICQLLKIDLRSGYLFRNTLGNSVGETHLSSTAVYNRIKNYLKSAGIDCGETPHSFRSGCAITLTILGVQRESIAKHIGWTSTNMLDHYSDLREALKPSAPAAVLAESTSQASVKQVTSTYHTLDDVSSFIPALH